MNELLKNIAPNDIEKFRLLKQLFLDKANDVRQVTLKEFYDEYIAYAESYLSPKSVVSVKQSFKPLMHFFSLIRPLNTIKLIDIEKFIRKIQATAPKGYRVYVRTLKAAFNKAKEWSYLNENPFDKLKLPRVQLIKNDYLKSEDIEQIVNNTENELIKNVILFASNTGMRLGEIANLRWEDVDFNNKIITVGSEQFTTKSKKVRDIPMGEVVHQLLRNIFEKNKVKKKYVFGKTAGTNYTTDYLSKKFKVAFRKTDIKNNYNFHSLRHSFASRLAQSGVPIVTISKLLGHSNISTTMIYSLVDLDDSRRAIDKLNYRKI